MYYKYDNLSSDYYRLQHEYNIYDDENNLIHKYLFNKDTYYDENLDPILHTGEVFCICLKKYKKIKINLQLHRHNRHRIGNINLEINDDNENYINTDYIDKHNENIEKNKNDISSNLGKIDTNKNDISSNLAKIDTNKSDISSNLGKIDTNKNNISSNLIKIYTNKDNISSNLGKIYTNKNDISTNLIKINSNEDDILYNLSEINYIQNNNSTQYLKNVYNILFYNKKTQIDFRNLFYEKVFDVNASINDFIEMNFKILLEYQSISNRNYVKTIYELFDENDNFLYVKSVNNNDYSYYSNKIFIHENIFYNFTKSIKKITFVIKFQMILSRVIKIWYIKNDNYRLVIKNYGV